MTVTTMIYNNTIAKMKYLIFSILFLGLISSCQNNATSDNSNTAPEKAAKKKPLSPPASSMAMIGGAHIHIDYSSPGVRGRTIFGELIPYNKLWRAGANDATSIETNKDLEVGGQSLSAGKYGIFVIPNKDKWTVIFNTRWKQHGTDKYNEKEDVIRVDVMPTTLENLQEHLEYKVIKSDEQSGIISLAWEKTNVEIPFNLK